jgi:hypothetical protein
MMPWSHELSSADIESDESIAHSLAEPGTVYEIKINMKGNNPTMLKRYFGCIMIGFMPDEGLDEALLSLRDMLDFYRHKPTPLPPMLSPKTISGTITNKKKRPDLVIA